MEETNDAGTALPVSFTGTAREYFGIWIVNILLTIVTLGLYFPWAKVRTMRYFYGNTQLDDSPFDYLASPKAIFKGWLIALAVFIAYSAITKLVPLTGPLFTLVFVFALPWIIVRSMGFRLRNTAYRNIRFNFDKNYREAIKVFVGIAMLLPFTLGLIFPYYLYRQKKFYVTHAAFGQDRFQFPAMARKFYEIYLVVAMIFLALVVAMSFTLPAALSPMVPPLPVRTANGMAMSVPWVPIILMASLMLTSLLSYPYLQAAVTNAVWNNASVAGHRFESTLTTAGLMRLYFINSLAIMFSFGLMVPWARVRLARYRAENITLLANGDLSGFIAAATSQESATGEELGEVFDVDVGL